MSLGLLLTAFGLGLRHGIDWDHIAAIADLNGTTKDRTHGFLLSMAYAVGHGCIVFALGTAAIVFGQNIPDSLDHWMGRIVGVTLIALGIWILSELLRKGRDFRLRSRWMFVLDGTFAGLQRVRHGVTGRKIAIKHSHEHEHEPGEASHGDRVAHDHAHVGADSDVVQLARSGSGWASWRERAHRHSHAHRHELALPDRPGAAYGHRTATGIGMLHGVGIESPSQIALFVATSAVSGLGIGLLLLGAWVAGLIIANAGLALVAGAGILNAERSFPFYAGLAVIIGVLSIALGTLYLFGLDLLPSIS